MSSRLEQTINNIVQGDHVCSIFEDPAEQLSVTAAFVKAGLARGQRCIHVADDRTFDEVRRALAAAGVDVTREQERGALRLLTKWDAHLRAGEFDPEAMLEFLRREETRALADGFSGLWISGEMTWALGKEPGCDRLIEYEALLNQIADLHKSVVLCQYNEALFGRPCIHHVLRAHPGGVLQADTAAADRAAEARAGGGRDELYRFLMENTHDVVSLYDVDGRRVYVSPSSRRLLGWVPAGPFDGVHPEDLPAVRQAWQRVLAGEKTVITYRFAHAEKSWRWLEVTASLVPFRGAPHVLAVSRDVTEQTQAFEVLREREELLRLLTESTNEFIRLFDLDGQVVYANPAVERFLGQVPPDFAGFTAAEDVEASRQWWEQTLAGNTDPLYWRVRARGGDWHWMESQGAVVSYHGKPHVLTVCRDVTRRQVAEEALRESEHRLQEAERLAHVGYWDHDLDTGRITWSRETYRILGLKPPEVSATRQEFLERIHPEDRRLQAEASERAQRGEARYDLEYRVVRPDGEVRTLHSVGDVIRDPSGRPRRAFGVVQDTTERKRAEKALRESAERLHALSRRLLEVQEEERRHLARELHDEFGQLLTGLRLLLRPKRDVPAEAVLTRLEQARSIVDQLLERVRGLSFDLRPAALDQLGLLPALLTLGERYTGQTGVRIDFQHQGMQGQLPPEVETAAYRVVQEALTNVARHAKVSSVTVRVWTLPDALHVQVEDSGRGFDVEAALASPRSGGLAGMQERVLLLGGKLCIESRMGAGTQVTAELPLPSPEGPP